MRTLPAALALVSLLLPAAAVADEVETTLYQWTDAEGVIRYATDRDLVPGSQRDTIVPLGAEVPVPTSPGLEAPAGTIPSVMGAPVPPGALTGGDATRRGTVPGSEFSESPLEGAPPADPPPVSSAGEASGAGSLDDRIALLEQQIADDEETLKQLISAKGPGDAEHAARVREIASRLPDLQADLRALRHQRATQGGP